MASNSNRLRIIGGTWRSRILRFPDVEGLRPTPDRVRETLFNWLAPVIEGARCLDLFAGSGALGFEALSRGAASATFVERDARAVSALRENIATLKSDAATVVHDNALTYLQRTAPAQPFHIVFIDPPYHQGLVDRALDQLSAAAWLAPGALLFIEAEKNLNAFKLPPDYRLSRSKVAGQVGYHLARV